MLELAMMHKQQSATYRVFDGWYRDAHNMKPSQRQVRSTRKQDRITELQKLNNTLKTMSSGARGLARTLIVTMFGDGSHGPSAHIFGEASRLPDYAQRDANATQAPEHMFYKLGKRSHMNDNECMLLLLDTLVREAVRQRRYDQQQPAAGNSTQQ